MATEVEICSAALVELGAKPIADFEDDTTASGQCAVLWPTAADDLMRAHPWNCLVSRVTLSPINTAPPHGYAHWFERPGDWLRTMDVRVNGAMVDYQAEGRRLLSDSSVLHLTYVAKKDPADWDVHLVDLAIKRMKWGLAYTVTKSTSLRDAMMQEYMRALKVAKAIDGQENPAMELEWSSSLVDNRMRG